MTPIELRQKGDQALLAALGPIETIRFLQQAGWGRRQLHRRTPSVAYPSYTGGILQGYSPNSCQKSQLAGF